MNRTIIYSLEQIRSFDYLWSIKDTLIGLSTLARGLLGNTNTVVYGLAGSQTTSPSLVINIAQGWIIQQAVVDATAYGALPSDATLIEQIGFAPAQTLTVTVPTMSAGQACWALIEASFTPNDVIRTNDPNNGVLPYVNTANPAQPFQGPNNNNQQQDTERQGVCTLQIKYGTPATAGSNVPPTTDANYVPVYLINLAFGQTTITNGQILVAGTAAYSGYAQAPFFPGVTGSVAVNPSGSHHGGVAGQGNKIVLTNNAEVQGVAAFSALPVSNTSPGSGGIITSGPDIPVWYIVNANPNTNLAGNVLDCAFDTVNGLIYVCTTSGSSGGAVWTNAGTNGTITSGTSGKLAVYTASTTIGSAPDAALSAGALTLGLNTSVAGSVTLEGATSGSSIIAVPAVAGTSSRFQLPGNNGSSNQVLLTDGSGNTSWSSTLNRYISGAQNPTLNSQITLTHGLGSQPFKVWLVFQNLSAELSYAIGDQVIIWPSSNAQITINTTATQILLNLGASTPVFTPKGGGSASGITYAKWEIFVYAEI